MGDVLGDVLLLGMGTVLGPVPLLVVILLLSGTRGRAKGVAYTLGWVAGLAALVLIVALLLRNYEFDRGQPRLILSWFKIIGGLLLLAMAIWTWRRRPPPDSELELPGWFKLVERASPLMALGAGVFFGLVSIRNLIFTMAVASSIGRAQLSVALSLFFALLYVVIATVGIATPVWIAFARKEQADAIFARWVGWLSANNALIVTLVSILLGVRLFGDGLGDLL